MSKRAQLENGLRAEMEAAGIDAVIGVSPENVQHLSGVFIASQRMIRDRLAFAVFCRVGPPFFVVSTVVAYTARSRSWIEDVVTYREHAVRPIDGLVNALKDRGLDRSRVWVETGALPTRDGDRLRAALPGLEIEDAEAVLDRSRMIKAPEEIERMRRNLRIWETAVRDGFMATREGDAERVIAERMAQNILAGGAEWVPFTIFSTGPEHTMINHWVPDETPVRRGDIMMVDMVGFFGGYYTDAARMAIVHEAAPAQKDAYRRMLTVQRALIEQAKPGVVASDMYRHAVAVAKEQGMELEMPDVGHSLGIRLHEYPILSLYESQVLAEDMVLCLEIAHKFEGLGNFHVEDVVRLSADGNELLTSLIDTDEMMVVG